MLKSMEQLHIRLKEVLPILETITDAVFIDNNEGICLWCNTTCEELYDIEMEEIQGKTVDELERAGIFSPSVTKRVLQEEREQKIQTLKNPERRNRETAERKRKPMVLQITVQAAMKMKQKKYRLKSLSKKPVSLAAIP